MNHVPIQVGHPSLTFFMCIPLGFESFPSMIGPSSDTTRLHSLLSNRSQQFSSRKPSSMDVATFRRWLGEYGRAWETCDPDAAAQLFTSDASYQWGPLEQPLRGREQIRARWEEATGRQREVRFGSEPLSVSDERGIARWWVSFIRDDQRVKLEGIFDISLTADSLCQSLREWWNAEGEPRGPSGEAEGEGTDSDQDAAAPVGERAIRALGEVALRVKDLDRMQSFYEKTVGLELMKRFPKSAFFRVAQGVGGHTQVFVLFDRSGDPESNGITAKATTLHHGGLHGALEGLRSGEKPAGGARRADVYRRTRVGSLEVLLRQRSRRQPRGMGLLRSGRVTKGGFLVGTSRLAADGR